MTKQKLNLILIPTALILTASINANANGELSVANTNHGLTVSRSIASKTTYGATISSEATGLKLTETTKKRRLKPHDAFQSGFKWGGAKHVHQVSDSSEDEYAPKANNAFHSGYRWGIRSDAKQAGYRWGIRSDAKQAGYRWGIRSDAKQAGYRWGIRSDAKQAGYRWGIRSDAKQAGYRWGIRNQRNQD